VIQPVVTAAFVRVTDLPGSHRGAGGFGSTGTASAATNLGQEPSVAAKEQQ